jgi:hypothetical protein
MDINELNKTQLVLLTLLITFVVSIATGIVTVSLMQKAPKTVPQLVNNVIERTIEKVSTDPTTTASDTTTDDTKGILLGSSDSPVVSIYGKPETVDPTATTPSKELGQGVIISDIGLILVDSSVLPPDDSYTVTLNTTSFDATILKTYLNGFSMLKISPQTTTPAPADTTAPDTSTQ